MKSSLQFLVEKYLLKKSEKESWTGLHEKLGNVRGHTNKEYGQMSDDQITEWLKVLGEIENHSGDTTGQRRERLITFERTRHLMIWGMVQQF